MKAFFSVENYLQDSLNTAHNNPNWGTTRLFLRKYTIEKITVKYNIYTILWSKDAVTHESFLDNVKTGETNFRHVCLS